MASATNGRNHTLDRARCASSDEFLPVLEVSGSATPLLHPPLPHEPALARPTDCKKAYKTSASIHRMVLLFQRILCMIVIAVRFPIKRALSLKVGKSARAIDSFPFAFSPYNGVALLECYYALERLV
jgi:hypothetical protein